MMACNSKEVAAPVIDKEQIKKEIQAKENEFAEQFVGNYIIKGLPNEPEEPVPEPIPEPTPTPEPAWGFACTFLSRQ